MTTVNIPFNTGEEDDSDFQGAGVAAQVSSISPTGARVEFGGIEPEVDLRSLEAFETSDEMAEAVNAKLADGSTRMSVDAQYRAEVEARIALSMGTARTGLNQTPAFQGREGSTERRNQMSSLRIEVTRPEDAFDSMDEVVVAMSDRRYSTDPRYRSEVDAKIGRSTF